MTQPIRSACGQFYAGMTKSEVGTFSRPLFDKIDQNKDKVLQDNEICDYRDEEAKTKEQQGDMVSSALIGLGLYGAPQVSQNLAAKIREETNQYRQEHFGEQPQA